MDKIPIEDATAQDNIVKLYGQEISVVDGGNIDKINQLIEWCRELQTRDKKRFDMIIELAERVSKLEGK